MIDITKEYKTRVGQRVKLLTDEGSNSQYPILGAILNKDSRWEFATWTADGREVDGDNEWADDLILIPVVETFIAGVTLNLYKTGAASFMMSDGSRDPKHHQFMGTVLIRVDGKVTDGRTSGEVAGKVYPA